MNGLDLLCRTLFPPVNNVCNVCQEAGGLERPTCEDPLAATPNGLRILPNSSSRLRRRELQFSAAPNQLALLVQPANFLQISLAPRDRVMGAVAVRRSAGQGSQVICCQLAHPQVVV
jgi:hypothetical protein